MGGVGEVPRGGGRLMGGREGGGAVASWMGDIG